MKIFDHFRSDNPKSHSLIIMSQHMRIWRICGYWPRSKYTALYYVYSITLHTNVSVLLTFSILMSLTQATQMEQITDITLPAIVSIVTSIKGFLIYRNRKYISKLFGIMQQMEATGRGRRAAEMWDIEQEQAILNGAQNVCTKMLIFILACTNLCCTMCYILPYFRNGRVLMWPALVPWNWHDNLVLYYATNTTLYAFTLVHGFMMSTGDVYGPSMYILLGAHFDILSLRLRNLGKRHQSSAAADPKEPLATVAATRRTHLQLNECIKYHLMSMK